MDGTCNDEVYVFTSSLALGPFCGFDDAFNSAPITESNPFFDYYYYDLIGNHNLGNMATGVSQAYSIRVGIQTGSTVRSYGFKFSWTTSEPAPIVTGYIKLVFKQQQPIPSSIACIILILIFFFLNLNGSDILNKIFILNQNSI